MFDLRLRVNLCFFFSVCAVATICAQGNAQKQFEQIFCNEMNEQDEQPLKKEQFSMGVSVLPVWFWHIPASTSDACYAIGISDPEMEDSLGAFNQALQRALMQINLMDGLKTKGLTDLYNKDVQYKYEELYKFSGDSLIHGRYTVVDSMNTLFNEKVLLVKLDRTSKQCLPIKTSVEVYKSNTKIEIGWCNSEKLNYSTEIDTNRVTYEFLQDDRQCDIQSVRNNDTIQIPKYMYEYKADTDSDGVISPYNKGLWSEYFESFVNGLQVLTANNRSKVKSLTELYNKNETNNLNSINRDIISTYIKFKIDKIDIKYKKLNIELSVF